MSRTRSAPARTARSDTVVMPAGREGRPCFHRVRDHDAAKAQLPAQHVLDHDTRLRRDARGVERGIPRVPDHDQRDTGADRRPEGTQVYRVELGARATDGHWGTIGVHARRPESGEVLRGRGDATRAPAPDGSGHRTAHRPRVGRERPARECRALDAGDVADRRQADGDAGGAKRPRGGLGVRAHGPRRDLRGLGAGRRRPGEDADVSPLLVDGDDRSRSRQTQSGREVTQLGRRADVAPEQDHSRRAPAAQRPKHVGRRCRALEAQEEQVPDLLLERLRKDDGPGFCARRACRAERGDREYGDDHARSRPHGGHANDATPGASVRAPRERLRGTRSRPAFRP